MNNIPHHESLLPACYLFIYYLSIFIKHRVNILSEELFPHCQLWLARPFAFFMSFRSFFFCYALARKTSPVFCWLAGC